MLSQGSSHRTTTDQELITWGEPMARLDATVSTGRIEVVLLAAGSMPGARKRVKVNGVPRRTSALSGALRAVVFAPEDMQLVVGSPSLRRLSLDTLVAQHIGPAAASHVDLRPGPDPAQQPAAPHPGGGRRAATSCRTGTGSWSPRAAASCAGAPRPWPRWPLPSPMPTPRSRPAKGLLTIRSVSNAAPEPGESPEDALRRRLAETAEKEIWNGATLVGPHRDDMAFDLDGRELSGFASRGQQRTAILAYKLAQLDLLTQVDGRPPLLLLDDVFSRARSAAARPPRAPHRRPAAGVRDHDGARGPGPGARGRGHRVAGRARPPGACRDDPPPDAPPVRPAARRRDTPGHRRGAPGRVAGAGVGAAGRGAGAPCGRESATCWRSGRRPSW